jgi:hypothetical protein
MPRRFSMYRSIRLSEICTSVSSVIYFLQMIIIITIVYLFMFCFTHCTHYILFVLDKPSLVWITGITTRSAESEIIDHSSSFHFSMTLYFGSFLFVVYLSIDDFLSSKLSSIWLYSFVIFISSRNFCSSLRFS